MRRTAHPRTSPSGRRRRRKTRPGQSGKPTKREKMNAAGQMKPAALKRRSAWRSANAPKKRSAQKSAVAQSRRNAPRRSVVPLPCSEAL